MDIGELRESFGKCTEPEIIAGCHAIDPSIETWERARDWIGLIVKTLLERNRYRAAARLLWSNNLFDPRPKSVAKILSTVEANAQSIILGAASSGKSYTVVAWLILDWLRDVEYTGVRIISTTKSHSLDNTFSSLQRFYDEAIIPLPGFSQHGFIGIDPKDRHASLSVIAIKDGDTGKNALQGFHPIRRKVPHPVFGKQSRIRIFLDECEMIPNGVWRGVGNILSNLEGHDTVKVVAACNPWDVTSVVAANAEPSQGYNKVNPDADFEWVSELGYKVVRLDAAYSENVLQKKNIYEGLMTWQGYENKRMKTGGNDADYWTYARGMYPLQGTVEQLIPLSFLDDFYGEFIFQPGTVVGVGAVDLAFEGDDCVFFAGRYGRASAFRPAGGGPIIELAEPRYVFQADQFRTIINMKRTEATFNAICQIADAFSISYDWLAVDKTGVGRGVHDMFIERGFGSVTGIGWGQAATHTKILDEHRSFADDVYDGISSEMYFCLRDYLEFGFIKCSPYIDMTKLQKELIGRKRMRSRLGPTGEVMYKLEEKKAFKARYGFSPDRADALVMALHVSRTKGPEKAIMAKKRRQVASGAAFDSSSLENITHIDFSAEA